MKGLMKSAASLPRFALDCGFWRTRRYAGASPAVVGLQTAAISYCYEHGTDGWIPDDGLATSLGFKERDAAKLVPEMLRRTIWTTAPGGGFLIVGFLDHNPSRAQVQKERQKRAHAGQKGNHDRWHQEQSQEGCQWCSDPPSHSESESDRTCDPVPDRLPESQEKTREDETREDETREYSARLPTATPEAPPPTAPGRARRLHEDFVVSDEMRRWAAQECPTVPIDAETAKFRDHWRAKAGKDATKLDWPATWRNWIRTAAERRPNGNSLAPRDRVGEALARARANPL